MTTIKLSRIKLIIGIALIFMIITNPSIKEFKEFIGISPAAEDNNAVRRTHNFILFSIYQEANDKGEFYYSTSYLGIASNFFESPF